MGIKIRNIILIFALVLFSFVGVSSCGLDTFYTLNGPYLNYNAPLITNTDPNNNFVEFRTNEDQSHLPGDFKFTGTAVFYKIYSNTNTIISHDASISSVNNESNYNSAAERLVSFGYRQLRTDSSADTPLIPNAGQSRRVRIRLTDYNQINALQPNDEFKPLIMIKDDNGNILSAAVPRRVEGGGRYTFDFGRHNNDSNVNPLPESGNEDYDGGTSSDGIYYVNMYAVGVGFDVTYKTYYSTVLHLGTIKIDSASEIN